MAVTEMVIMGSSAPAAWSTLACRWLVHCLLRTSQREVYASAEATHAHVHRLGLTYMYPVPRPMQDYKNWRNHSNSNTCHCVHVRFPSRPPDPALTDTNQSRLCHSELRFGLDYSTAVTPIAAAQANSLQSLDDLVWCSWMSLTSNLRKSRLWPFNTMESWPKAWSVGWRYYRCIGYSYIPGHARSIESAGPTRAETAKLDTAPGVLRGGSYMVASLTVIFSGLPLSVIIAAVYPL